MHFASLNDNRPSLLNARRRPRRFIRVNRLFRANRPVSVFIAILAVFVVVGAIFSFIAATGNQTTHTGCVVTDKDRTSVQSATNHSSKSEQRIYTENCGVLTADDNFLLGNLNSSDTYGSIKVGQTYDFTTTGFRIPVLSQFPNINEVHLSSR